MDYQPQNQLEQEGSENSIEQMYRLFVQEELPQLYRQLGQEQNSLERVRYEMTRFYSLAQKVIPERKIKPRAVRITLPLGSGEYRMPEYRRIECTA